MKKFFILLAITGFSLYILFRTNTKNFTVPQYLSDNVLDTARPINVNIDLDLLERLDPAYEQ